MTISAGAILMTVVEWGWILLDHGPEVGVRFAPVGANADFRREVCAEDGPRFCGVRRVVPKQNRSRFLRFAAE